MLFALHNPRRWKSEGYTNIHSVCIYDAVHRFILHLTSGLNPISIGSNEWWRLSQETLSAKVWPTLKHIFLPCSDFQKLRWHFAFWKLFCHACSRVKQWCQSVSIKTTAQYLRPYRQRQHHIKRNAESLVGCKNK